MPKSSFHHLFCQKRADVETSLGQVAESTFTDSYFHVKSTKCSGYCFFLSRKHQVYMVSLCLIVFLLTCLFLAELAPGTSDIRDCQHWLQTQTSDSH